MCAKSLQSCPTLCNPMDCSPPGSSVHGILQARVLEWVAMPCSRGIFPTQGLNLHHYWVSYIACRFFTIEPPGKSYNSSYRSDFSKSGNRSCLPILVCFIPKIGFQSFCFLPLSRLLSSGQNVSHDGLMDNVSFCKTFI